MIDVGYQNRNKRKLFFVSQSEKRWDVTCAKANQNYHISERKEYYKLGWTLISMFPLFEFDPRYPDIKGGNQCSVSRYGKV